DAELQAETLRQTRAQVEAPIARLTPERAVVARAVTRCHAEIRRAAASEATPAVAARMAALMDQVSQSEGRLAEIDREIADLQAQSVTERDVVAALADFDRLWAALSPREQVRVVQLLVHRVDYDAADSSIEVTFYPSGIRALAAEGRADDCESASV